MMDGRTGMMLPQAKQSLQAPKAERSQKGSFLQISEGTQPRRYLDFGLQPPELWDDNFCASKLPGLWNFVTVILGNEYSKLYCSFYFRVEETESWDFSKLSQLVSWDELKCLHLQSSPVPLTQEARMLPTSDSHHAHQQPAFGKWW